MRKLLCCIVPLLLTACIPSSPSNIETPLTTVRLSSKAAKMQPVMMSILTVRVHENIGTKRIWIEERAGVICKVSSALYSATVTTPARLAIPVYNALPDSAKITCTFDGETKTQHAGSCILIEGVSQPSMYRSNGPCARHKVDFIFKQ